MKKKIKVYDDGKRMFYAEIPIDNLLVDSIEIFTMSFNAVEYSVLYVVGMDYGIVIPKKVTNITIVDDINIH